MLVQVSKNANSLAERLQTSGTLPPDPDGPHGCSRNSLLVTGFLVIGSFGGISAIISNDVKFYNFFLTLTEFDKI